MPSMSSFDLGAVPSGATEADPGARVTVLLDEGRAKLRRLELDADGEIPPCRMKDDVVFVVLQGSIVLTWEAEQEIVSAPGAAYVPGGAATRSLRALEPALLVAVVCKGDEAPARAEPAPAPMGSPL